MTDEKLIQYDGKWHIVALDKFDWARSEYERLPGAEPKPANATQIEFVAWGDREGRLICLVGQEERLEDLPQ